LYQFDTTCALAIGMQIIWQIYANLKYYLLFLFTIIYSSSLPYVIQVFKIMAQLTIVVSFEGEKKNSMLLL